MPIYTPPGIDPDVLYVVGDDDGFLPVQYARTPDGIGMHWYEDEAEAVGDMVEGFTRVTLSSYHLDVLRGDDEPGRQRTTEWCQLCQHDRCSFE